MAGVRLSLAIACLTLAGCKVTGTFTCDTSDQCRASTGQGVCEIETGFCTFADADCASGTRYADNAGMGLAGRCTGEEPLVDAPPFDVAPFDTSTCPAKFDITLPSVPNAKFYLDLTTGTYQVVAARCIAELQGATHPANVHSAQTITEIAALFNFGGPGWIYVGVLQDPAATMPISGWINMDGSAFDATLWSSGPPVQPDDANGAEGDHAQQVAAVLYTGELGDYATTAAVPLLCACDGVPVADRAMTFLTGDGD
jgi:hypothetical protein